MSAVAAASVAWAPGAKALRLQPSRPGLPRHGQAARSRVRPIGSSLGGLPDGGQAASSGGSSGQEARAAEDSPASTSSGSSSSIGAPSTKQTLEALDQLLGVEAQPEPSLPPPPPPQQQPPAAPQAKRMGEPQLTFYDPNEEAEWKHTTRCVLVGVVGFTALLFAMVVPVALVWLISHGIPLDRLGDISRLKEGECLELQERMLCRRELDNFKL